MTITRIQAGVRDPSRCNLYVDGEFRMALPAEVALEYHLKAGMEISSELLEELSQRDEAKRAQSTALELLSRRSHGREELRRKLTAKGYDGEIAEQVCTRLAEGGYLDDEAHAQLLWEHLRQKGWGAGRIRQEMRSQGLEAQVVEQVLQQQDEQEDAEKIRQLIERKLRFGRSSDAKLKKRICDMLARYGYRYSQYAQIVEEYFDEGEDLWE
ncbi:MAG: regulatory protein RecX [Eubacteriales bacterium]|jgi:regulatory protein